MLRYQLTVRGKTVTITLDVAGPEDYGTLQFAGDPSAISDVQWDLYGCLGMDGHLIRENTCPIDLAAAMDNLPMRPYAPRRLAGDEILARYVRNPPPHG
jgi:hypothetical protein